MTTPTPITLVLADDHPVFLAGLRKVLEAESNIEILGEAADGEAALDLLIAEKPQIAVVDIGMPKLDGIRLLQEANKLSLPVAVIFMTMYRERKLFDRGMEIGLRGYVLKDSASEDLIKAVNEVAHGKTFVSPELREYLARGELDVVEGQRSKAAHLSASELRVLALIAEYKTSKEIADELFVSPRTVETHRTNICLKLGLKGRHALMKYALSRASNQTADI